MEMHDEPEYENVAMMDDAGIPVDKSLSLVDHPEVKRTRKILLIILIICLVSFYCIPCSLLDDVVRQFIELSLCLILKLMSLSVLYMCQKK